MKIIETGTTYKIYGEDLIVLDNLPPQTYRVGFGQFTGFFLEKQHELEVKDYIDDDRLDKLKKFKFSCVRIVPVNNGGIHYNLAI